MKKLFLVFLFILTIFMISAVSATEEIADLSDVESISLEEVDIAENSQIDNTKSSQVKVFRTTVVNTTPQGDAIIYFNHTNDTTGNIYFPDFNETIKVINGLAKYEVHNLSVGNNFIKFNYSGDNNSDPYNSTAFVDILEDIEIKQNDIVMYYKNGTKFIATVLKDKKPLANETVNIFINNLGYQRKTNENGTVFLNINLNPGQYKVKTGIRQNYYIDGIMFNPNYSYSETSNLLVLPTLFGNNMTKYYRNNTQYEITALNNQGDILVNSTVVFNINGVFYNRTTNAQGIAKLNINLAPGNYIITTTNNDSYKVSNNISVLPTIESNDLAKVFRNGSQFSVKLLNKDGTPIANEKLTMNIHGVIYKRTTNSQGLATLNINLAPGNYIITTENLKDGCMVSNNIEVKNYLYAFDMVKYYKNASRYSVKLVDENYKPVSGEVVEIEINGVKYTKTTNKDGIASLGINLLPGQYKAYAKCLNRDVSSITNINVIPTLYVYNENSASLNEEYNNYAVILLDGSGNPLANETVVYEVKNTKVDVKTNTEGIAKFPASKLSQYASQHPLSPDKIDVKVSYDNQFVNSSTYFVHGYAGIY